jgi:hypothetical protein
MNDVRYNCLILLNLTAFFMKLWFRTIKIACFISLFSATSAYCEGESSVADALSRALNQSSSFEDPYLGQVWLVTMSRKLERWIDDPDERIQLLTKIHAEASRAKL